MQRFRFPIAVAVTSLALVVGLVVAGGVVASNVLAFGPPWRGGWGAHDGFSSGFAMPPELAGLRDIAPDQRFSHFKGAQARLTDRDGQPLTVEVTPGTATSVSPTSLTIAANDGSTHTFSLNDQTVTHGKHAPTQNDQVVVLTMNSSTTAHGVLVMSGDGVGPWGAHAGWMR